MQSVNADADPTPWTVRTIYAGFTTRVVGYTVERIHKPYTRLARVENLEGGKLFRTLDDAHAAIAKAEL